jgi:hypothetical protein
MAAGSLLPPSARAFAIPSVGIGHGGAGKAGGPTVLPGRLSTDCNDWSGTGFPNRSRVVPVGTDGGAVTGVLGTGPDREEGLPGGGGQVSAPGGEA